MLWNFTSAQCESFDESQCLFVETICVETASDGDSYQPVNETPIDVEFALLDVTTGCNNHIALIHNNGTEANVVYEIIIGRTSESAIIIHPPANAATNNGEGYDVSSLLPLWRLNLFKVF